MEIIFRPKRFKHYANTKGLSLEAIYKQTGCDLCFPTTWYNADGSQCYDLRVNGETVMDDQWSHFGFAWNEDDCAMEMVHSADWYNWDNFTTCVPLIMEGEALELYCGEAHATRRCGQTVQSVLADGRMLVECVTDENGISRMDLQEKLVERGGVISSMSWDGGRTAGMYSKLGNVPQLNDYGSTAPRTPVYVMLIWFEEEESVDDRIYKVCLDPGHGDKEPNCSPDRSYFESEFAFDMAQRVRAYLESTERFSVLLTKGSAKETPSLRERARRANEWGADIFLSQHSNAVATTDKDGDGLPDWNESAHGLTVWTYAPGGERERLANRLLDQYGELGVELFGSKLYNAKFAVLAYTNMPAVLIEHYFHTCKADVAKLLSTKERDVLALAQARGICEFFNMEDDLLPAGKQEEEVLEDIIYRIQLGAFENKENAKGYLEDLKKQGVNAFIKEEKKK